MNATQMKYAKERANEIYRNRQRAIEDKYRAKQLTTEQYLDALEAGRFKIDRTKANDRWNWTTAVIFIDVEPDKGARQKEIDELAEVYRNLIDELVLGDNEEALKLLKNFEKSS